MIPKSGYRFSEKIMRQQKTTERRRTWSACIVLRRRNEGGSPGVRRTTSKSLNNRDRRAADRGPRRPRPSIADLERACEAAQNLDHGGRPGGRRRGARRRRRHIRRRGDLPLSDLRQMGGRL